LQFDGVEFLDRDGISLIKAGTTKGPFEVIQLQEDEKVIGVNAVADPDGRLY
jgi:hypothetical protein